MHRPSCVVAARVTEACSAARPCLQPPVAPPSFIEFCRRRPSLPTSLTCDFRSPRQSNRPIQCRRCVLPRPSSGCAPVVELSRRLSPRCSDERSPIFESAVTEQTRRRKRWFAPLGVAALNYGPTRPCRRPARPIPHRSSTTLG
jgi:hypothetical protein